jgi:hypothetical protein
MQFWRKNGTSLAALSPPNHSMPTLGVHADLLAPCIMGFLEAMLPGGIWRAKTGVALRHVVL